MKMTIKSKALFGIILFIVICFVSCKKEPKQKTYANHLDIESVEKKNFNKQTLSQEFKDYWYAGNAEITSFKLEQARYGELRLGTAVLVYVTEDFLPEIQVKADNWKKTNIPVLKLNATKNFNTGIYPYSIMQSTFYPVSNNDHALKVSSSVQEWCGHAYTQINNRDEFLVMSHSYFEGEADQNFQLPKAFLENEIWTKLRIDPNTLPTGDIKMIPSLEFTRLKHKPIKAYQANANLKKGSYTITYPELERTLIISFNTEFPFEVTSWEESFKSGFGPNAKTLITKATKLKTLKSAYWTKNSNADEPLRETLELN